MFMVFNKEKILSYFVSLSTVVLLFVISFAVTKKNDDIIKTSANAIMSNTTNKIENVDIENNDINESSL